MANQRTVPTYDVPLASQGNTNSAWYRWIHGIDSGIPPSSEVSITVGASPFTYQAPRGGFVIVQGGSVSQIAFSRTAGTNYVTGQTAGMFSVALNDNLIVTYASKPTMTFVPT